MALSQQELQALQEYLLSNPFLLDLIDDEEWSSIQGFLSLTPDLLDNPTNTRTQLLTVLPDEDKAKLYSLDDPNFSSLRWLGTLYQKRVDNTSISPINFSPILTISDSEITYILLMVDKKIQEERLTDITVPKVIREIFNLVALDRTQEAIEATQQLLIALLVDGLINLSIGLIFYIELSSQERWRSLNLSELPTVGEIETAINLP